MGFCSMLTCAVWFLPWCVSVLTVPFPTCERSSCWPPRAETSQWSLLWWTTETSPSTLSKTSSCQRTCTPETTLLSNHRCQTFTFTHPGLWINLRLWDWLDVYKSLLCLIYNVGVFLVPKVWSVGRVFQSCVFDELYSDKKWPIISFLKVFLEVRRFFLYVQEQQSQ